MEPDSCVYGEEDPCGALQPLSPAEISLVYWGVCVCVPVCVYSVADVRSQDNFME